MIDRIRQFALAAAVICLLAVTPNWVIAQDAGHAPAGDHAAAPTDSHATGKHPAGGHAAGGHGEYTIWGDLPFWSGIAFLGFVGAIFKLGLWDYMKTNMAVREQAERDAISAAEGHLSEADHLLRTAKGRIEALDENVRATLAEGQRDAQYTRDEFIKLAEKEAAAAVERARHEIERVKNQSLNELFESLADKVASTTEQRLRSGLQAEDQRRLVDSMLGQFSRN